MRPPPLLPRSARVTYAHTVTHPCLPLPLVGGMLVGGCSALKSRLSIFLTLTRKQGLGVAGAAEKERGKRGQRVAARATARVTASFRVNTQTGMIKLTLLWASPPGMVSITQYQS